MTKLYYTHSDFKAPLSDNFVYSGLTNLVDSWIRTQSHVGQSTLGQILY